jgi:hypothetical protein
MVAVPASAAPAPAAADAAGEAGYAAGVYLVVVVLAALPLLGFVQSLLRLGAVLAFVRAPADVGSLTVLDGAGAALGLLAQAALLWLVLRRRVTPARLGPGSWIGPALLAVATVCAFAGAVAAQAVATRVLAAVAGPTALARHSITMTWVQVATGLGHALVIAGALLAARARCGGAPTRKGTLEGSL